MSAIEQTIIVYHINCPDGIGAAWCFWRKYITNYEELNNDIHNLNVRVTVDSNIITIGVQAGSTEFPLKEDEYNNKNIVIVDVSFPKNILLEVKNKAKSILVLDHHASSQADLSTLDFCQFDMTRCATQMAWDFLIDEKYPYFIDVIADRDLWQWSRHPNSRDISAAMFHKNYNRFEILEYLYRNQVYQTIEHQLINIGKIVNEIKNNEVITISKSACNVTLINTTYKVKLVGCSHDIASDVGNYLATNTECDFVVLWRYNYETDNWNLSLRSNGFDLIQLRTILTNLGGHQRAAGCTIYGSKNENLRTYFKLDRH